MNKNIITHTNANLLFFLSMLIELVLDGLEGSFKKTAKYKFGKLSNLVKGLNKELDDAMDDDAHKTYLSATYLTGELINMSMNHYNDNNLIEFINYCKSFKK